MSEAVARFLAAHASATGTESRQYADPFVSTQWAIAELGEALDLARHKVRSLQAARIEQSIGRMVDAQKELDLLLSQATLLSETVARVVKAHADRSAREQTVATLKRQAQAQCAGCRLSWRLDGWQHRNPMPIECQAKGIRQQLRALAADKQEGES